MAGDWIKMEVSTPDKAEVLAITARMGWDDVDTTVGKLFRLWRWFDQHTLDGNAVGVTPALLDRIVGVTGFCEVVSQMGWLCIEDGAIKLPNFDRHNGMTAKNRALTAKRVSRHKSNAKANDEGNGASVTSVVSLPLPREEKRREDIDTPRKRGNRKSAMPEDFAISERVQTWAQKNGFDHLELHLEHFKTAAKAKGYTYVDWDSAFENAIRQDWAKVRTGKQVNGAASRLDMFRGAL